MAVGLAVDPGPTGLDLFAYPFNVTSFRTPTPPIDPRFAQPADAHGDRLAALRYLNREITISIEIQPTEADPEERASTGQAALAKLADKIARTNREGVALQATLKTGGGITFDCLTADPLDPPRDIAWDVAHTERVELRFTAQPFWRGEEVSYDAVSERTNPVIVFTVDAPEGDVPALGRLVLTDEQGADQMWCVWGIQSRTYDPAATAALYYSAASRTAYSGLLSAHAYKAILSTRAAGDGSHLTHVGQYRVFARIQRGSGTGDFMVAFEWAAGDMLSFSQNPPVPWRAGDPSTAVRILDLGVVALPAAPRGGQQWEGRIIARSTRPGDSAPTPSSFWLVPVDEGSGELSATARVAAPTVVSAQDEFRRSAAVLTGSSLTAGGRWQGAGTSTTDFSTLGDLGFSSGAARTSGSEASTSIKEGRIATATTPTALTGCGVEAVITQSAFAGVLSGLVARYVDVDNFLACYLLNTAAGSNMVITKRVAARDTVLASRPVESSVFVAQFGLVVFVTASGSIYAGADIAAYGYGSDAAMSVLDADCASGGVLDNGTVGIINRVTATTGTALFAAFRAFPKSTDAVMYASRSSEVRHDGALREDSPGAAWGAVSKYEGDLLTVPPAGPEGRSVRVIAKASRVIPGLGADPAVDDIGARLHVTPRGLLMP